MPEEAVKELCKNASNEGSNQPRLREPLTEELSHGMIGRDLPARQRQRDGFRRRIPRTLPKVLEPASIQKLIDSAGSYRDKAILILLSRAGQRIAIGVQFLASMGFWAWNWRMLIASGALSQCG